MDLLTLGVLWSSSALTSAGLVLKYRAGGGLLFYFSLKISFSSFKEAKKINFCHSDTAH